MKAFANYIHEMRVGGPNEVPYRQVVVDRIYKSGPVTLVSDEGQQILLEPMSYNGQPEMFVTLEPTQDQIKKAIAKWKKSSTP
jgi:hypothetical protein